MRTLLIDDPELGHSYVVKFTYDMLGKLHIISIKNSITDRYLKSELYIWQMLEQHITDITNQSKE